MFIESEVERTTAATDALLGIVCLALLVQLLGTQTDAFWRRNIWAAVLATMAIASLLGAVAHGLTMAESTRSLLWKPLYLSLGLAVALLVVAAAGDGWGPRAARDLLPWAVAAGLLFVIATQVLGGAFLIFVIYEAAATLAALAIYASLAARGAPGAAAIATGLVLSLVAAGVQRMPINVRLGVRLDHNGVFHLVQMAAIVVIAIGVRTGLVTTAGGLGPSS